MHEANRTQIIECIFEISLQTVRKNTSVKTDDNMDNTTIPFIQEDSMGRIISLLETGAMDFSLNFVSVYTVDINNEVSGGYLFLLI